MSEFQELLLRQFKIDLLEKEKNPFSSFLRLKYNYDYSDICYIVDRLGEKTKTYTNYIYGSPRPDSISKLGDSKVLYGDAKDSFENEINWTLLAIRKYSDQIQAFVDKKDLYEKEILLGNYDKADIILSEIEQQICISLWSIEQRFLLIELQLGLKENTKFLNEINDKNKQWFIKYFAHFFSMKAEKELSVNQYNISLARLLYRYIKSDNQVDLKYFNFKLNFLEEETLSYLPDFLAIESFHSIIDRYISLVRILQIATINKETEDDEFLDSRLYYLCKKIDDDKIKKLRAKIDTNFEFNFNINQKDKEAINALDLYTNGEYLLAENKLKQCILNNPLTIELYEIYIKTLLVLNKPLDTIGDYEDSFQNKILSAFYDIFNKKEDSSESLNELERIAYNLSSFYSISFYLMNFYKEEVYKDNVLKPLCILNSNFANPTFIKYIQNTKIANRIEKEINHSASYEYLKLKDEQQLKLIENSNLSPHRKKILKAQYFQNNKSFDYAINEWKDLLRVENIQNFQKEKILQNLFYCKEAIGEYDKCIDLYVDNYFINPQLVANIKVDSVKKKIRTAKFKTVKHNINLPLFYRLTNSDDYEIHTAYECYMLAQECYTPTEFIKKDHNYSDKLLFFLSVICTLDIFKHSPFITSSKQKYNERIAVCKYLAEIDFEYKEEYQNEVERLTRRLIIQKGIQEIDESKIYVNQGGIVENELKTIEPVFNRFKMIGELKSEEDISIISLYSDKMYSFKYSNDDDGSEFSKDPQFDIYKDLFYFIREKFLFSKYGLQQYLSARIRHGVLLGELRPIFEVLNLITEKEKGIDKYKKNEEWDFYVSQLNDKYKIKFQEIFAKFSSEIDSLINEEILSKSLQIKTEDKNPDGWLDYTFEDYILKIDYVKNQNIKNEEDFINNLFKILWERTEKNLDGVKSKINGEIKEKFFQLILELEKGLSEIFDPIPKDLINNINEARVKIENKLTKIASWFSITESNISDFKINKIIDVSVEYTHQSNLNKTIHPNLNINCDSTFKGEFYPSLVDLFRIFLDNALKHSGIESGEIPIKIMVNENNNSLEIDFINPLAETINIEALNNKINSFSLDLDKSMKEGRSGFHKAMRIIKSDLNSNLNKMKLEINDKDEFCVNIQLNKAELIA